MGGGRPCALSRPLALTRSYCAAGGASPHGLLLLEQLLQGLCQRGWGARSVATRRRGSLRPRVLPSPRHGPRMPSRSPRGSWSASREQVSEPPARGAAGTCEEGGGGAGEAKGTGVCSAALSTVRSRGLAGSHLPQASRAPSNVGALGRSCREQHKQDGGPAVSPGWRTLAHSALALERHARPEAHGCRQPPHREKPVLPESHRRAYAALTLRAGGDRRRRAPSHRPSEGLHLRPALEVCAVFQSFG